MATIQLPNDFKEFLRLLNSEGVEYLLVGGYAIGHYGYPRATGDIDLWIAARPDNAARIVRVLKLFGFPTPGLSQEALLKRNQVVRMGVAPLRIELITSISGVEFDDCYVRRRNEIIDGVAVTVISLDDLKVNKRASGRPKDVNDLNNLP